MLSTVAVSSSAPVTVLLEEVTLKRPTTANSQLNVL